MIDLGRIDTVTQRFAIRTAERLDRKRLLHRTGSSAFMGLAFYLARGAGGASAHSLQPPPTVPNCSEPQGCGCPPHCGQSPCCVSGCSTLCSCNGTTCGGGCTGYDDWSGSNCWSCVDKTACTTTTCCDCHRTTSTHCVCATVKYGCSPTDTPMLIWANGGPVDPPQPILVRNRQLERLS